MAGYSSWPSPINDFKCTYKWLGQPLFWSLKYGQLCTPDSGTVNQVTFTYQHKRPNRLRNTTNAACIRRQHRSPKKLDGRPILNFLRVHISKLLILLREAQPVCRSCGAQVLNSNVVGGCRRPGNTDRQLLSTQHTDR